VAGNVGDRSHSVLGPTALVTLRNGRPGLLPTTFVFAGLARTRPARGSLEPAVTAFRGTDFLYISSQVFDKRNNPL
jgi:hypothetical protein